MRVLGGRFLTLGELEYLERSRESINSLLNAACTERAQ